MKLYKSLSFLHRYGAFAGAVKRADVSAQSSGAKVLEGLAHIAAQEQLLLRNSPDLRYILHSLLCHCDSAKTRCLAEKSSPCCRRFFAAAITKTDLAALLRSPAVAVQLAALRASNSLSQHVESLPSTALPFIVRQLQSIDGELSAYMISLYAGHLLSCIVTAFLHA